MANAHILVVEDEGIIAESIRLKLNRAGYTTAEVVASGEEAIAKATARRPDLALMDISLGPLIFWNLHPVLQSGG